MLHHGEELKLLAAAIFIVAHKNKELDWASYLIE